MARPQKTSIAVNRGIFSDIYKDCCKNDDERVILDLIIYDFLTKEVFKGEPATERAVAKLTGLSKSGVRVVEARAMEKIKKALAKKGIKSADDVFDTGSSRQANDVGGVDD